ncbi:hypothetical protein CXF59_07715 [Flavobacterium sp. ALD4]|uniref:hypothetical protein n=1 Tax=Flavobacterium sp. ALD4 TaxID=2058314 RepID=UPI000C31E9EA|nr:hypothetical protein [Flavobacterium sp. ALD4]PKH67774.1 hypothetical protein CXF59_07715 [Flavobacterium sp. ALD4]
MKKIITLLAISLFTLNAAAQEVKPATLEKAEKESCLTAKASNDKAMTAAEISKCKAEEKKCDATMAATEEKKCCAKKA